MAPSRRAVTGSSIALATPMQNVPTHPVRRDRGISRMWGVNFLPRSDRMGAQCHVLQVLSGGVRGVGLVQKRAAGGLTARERAFLHLGAGEARDTTAPATGNYD